MFIIGFFDKYYTENGVILVAQTKVKTEQLEQLLAQHIGDLETSTQGTAKVKTSVLAATVETIATAGTQTIDGTPVGVGDRVLVKDQSTASENGIYIVASGSWTRATDSDTATRFGSGTQVFVETGTDNGGQLWIHTTPSPIVLDTTSLTFARSSGTTEFSGWNTYSLDTNYLAATDLIVYATIYRVDNTVQTLTGYTDATATPTTIRQRQGSREGSYGSISMAVKAGDYWRVTQTGAGTVSELYYIAK